MTARSLERDTLIEVCTLLYGDGAPRPRYLFGFVASDRPQRQVVAPPQFGTGNAATMALDSTSKSSLAAKAGMHSAAFVMCTCPPLLGGRHACINIQCFVWLVCLFVRSEFVC